MKFASYVSRRQKIQALRREITADSVKRGKLIAQLLGFVREDEREKTMSELRKLYPEIAEREQAASRGGR